MNDSGIHVSNSSDQIQDELFLQTIKVLHLRGNGTGILDAHFSTGETQKIDLKMFLHKEFTSKTELF